MNKKNIIIFSPFFPPHIGGVETYVDELSKYLSKKHNVTVITPQIPYNTPVKEIRHNNVTIIRFPAFEIVTNYPFPKFWKKSFWKIFSEKYDIVISQTRFFSTTLIALIFAKITKTPIINVEHGSAFVILSNKFIALCSRVYDHTLGAKLIFNTVTVNIAISKTVAKFIKKFNNNKNVSVIYRGIEMENIDKIKPNIAIQNTYKNKIIITSVGRLTKWKGFDRSIDVIKNLPKDLQNKIVFLIIGDGEERKALERQASSCNSIIFLGKKSLEEVYSILKISDIFLHASLPGGGLATTLLEAMYCKCAIIASPYEGGNEPIAHGKNGYLTKTSFTRETPTLLKELINNKELRRKFGENAQNTVKNNFNWENAIIEYEKIIKSIAK